MVHSLRQTEPGQPVATEVHAMSEVDQHFFIFRITENGIGDWPLPSHVNVEMTLKLYNTAHCYNYG